MAAKLLAALAPEVDTVLVHDAARCLTPLEVFERVVEAVRTGAAGARGSGVPSGPRRPRERWEPACG